MNTPPAPAAGMRSRILEVLNTYEVGQYLQRRDVIFLPVGTVEMHGQMPLGVECALPLAVAQRLAEEADGLVGSGLTYFFPGATGVGDGTVQVSLTTGVQYLKEVCRSLLRQGFRRQVLVTAHGPAYITGHLLTREFFEETRCPIAYLDLCTFINRLEARRAGSCDFDKLIWGAYDLLGRLDELAPQPVEARTPIPEAITRCQRSGLVTGYYYSRRTQHGWWPGEAMTAAARAARAQEGRGQLEGLVAEIHIAQAVEALQGLDTYLQTDVWPVHGSRMA